MDITFESPIRILSLFSGIGGMDIGVRMALPNSRAAAYLEREAFCIETLVQAMEENRMAPAPLWTDATTFDGRPWRGAVDMVIGGAPCQPFSLAGKGLGSEDDRYLWPHIARILDEVQAPMVFLENVPGQLHRGFEAIGEELQGLGYRFEAGLVRAKDVGAPHKRERLFVFGYRPEYLADAFGSGGERWRNTGDLASTACRARGEGLQREWGGCPTDDQGLRGDAENLVDSTSIGRSEGWSEHGLWSGWSPLTDTGCVSNQEALVDSARDEQRGSHRQNRERWGVCEAGQYSDEEDLGNAERQGLEDGQSISGDLREELSSTLRAGVSLPMWPPGPEELDEWRAILQYRPDLAPAIPSVEPRIRDLAPSWAGYDWLHDAHEARIPRLAALGNGVCVPSVALALTLLVERAFDSLASDASLDVNYKLVEELP